MKIIKKYRVHYREYGTDGLIEDVREQVVEATNVWEASRKLRRYLDRLDPFFKEIEISLFETIEEFIR